MSVWFRDNGKRNISTTTKRDRKCRFCEKPIHAGEKSIVLEQVHVSPKRYDLHFHPECIIKMFEKSLNLITEDK